MSNLISKKRAVPHHPPVGFFTGTAHPVARWWRSSSRWTGPQFWSAVSAPSWSALTAMAAASEEPTFCTKSEGSWGSWRRGISWRPSGEAPPGTTSAVPSQSSFEFDMFNFIFFIFRFISKEPYIDKSRMGVYGRVRRTCGQWELYVILFSILWDTAAAWFLQFSHNLIDVFCLFCLSSGLRRIFSHDAFELCRVHPTKMWNSCLTYHRLWTIRYTSLDIILLRTQWDSVQRLLIFLNLILFFSPNLQHLHFQNDTSA